MAEVLQVQGKDAVVRLNHYPAINAIQNFDWEPRYNEENLVELGNEKFAAQTQTPEVGSSFELTATGSTVAMLRRMITVQENGEFAGYLAGDADSASPNAGTIYSRDLENAIFDVIENKKPGEVFSRSTLLPRLHLSQISMRSDANGNASETYNFEGDLARILPTGKHDAVTVPCRRVDGSATTLEIIDPAFHSFEVSGDAEDYVVLFAMIDEQIVPANAITPDLDGQFTLQAPFTALPGQRLSLMLYKREPGVFPTIQYPTAARFVKANQADIFLVAKSVVDIEKLAPGALNTYPFLTSDRMLRAQSVDLNIDLRREALRQIAKTDTGNAVFYRAATYPLNVTSSLNVLETTMKDHAKLQGRSESDILDINFEGMEWQIVLRYYHNGTTLQTTAFTDARVSGSGRRVQAGGRAEISWSFSGSNVIFEGV